MFERFTDGSRRVVLLAQEEARWLCHNYIGTQHILLGILRQGYRDEVPSAAAQALHALGITLQDARMAVKKESGRGNMRPTGHLAHTPRSKKLMELSLREALQVNSSSIGPEHLLLALIRGNESVGAKVLHQLVGDLNKVRAQVWQSIADAGNNVRHAEPVINDPLPQEQKTLNFPVPITPDQAQLLIPVVQDFLGRLRQYADEMEA